MLKYFTAQKIFHNGQFCTESALAVEEGRVLGILPRSAIVGEITDFGERILAPAWVDLQVNGCGGGLFSRDLNLHSLEQMLTSSIEHGTMGIQPTLITCSDEDIRIGLAVIKQAMAQKKGLWSAVIGMHLEGPYISSIRRGAHPASLIRPLDEKMLLELELAGREGILSYITLAAESVSPLQVARLSATGITVSLGHTGAAIGDSRALLRAGARCFTHLYNGMGDINSRDPHTLSLALEDARAYSGIIADGIHVAPENISIARRLLGQRLFLVTDATATQTKGDLTGLSFVFGGQDCTLRNGAIYNEEGSLAGSALTMQQGVENLGQWFGWETALSMASANAVRALNIKNPYHREMGDFTPGSRANFVVLECSGTKILGLESWLCAQKWPS